ncbi:MAG: hypothetical protein WAN46_07430 [Gammaproteobacteria bacterium]
MMSLFADLIGMLGTCLVVLAFFAIQLEKISPKGLMYNLMNLSGATLLLISLTINFNLASFVIELFWIGASLVGLIKLRQRRHAAPFYPSQPRVPKTY